MLSSWARQKQARWSPQALTYLVIQVTLVADADNAPSISLCPEHSVPPAPLPKASRGDSGRGPSMNPWQARSAEN